MLFNRLKIKTYVELFSVRIGGYRSPVVKIVMVYLIRIPFSYGSKLFGVFKSVAGTVTQVGTTDLVERSDFTTATSGFSITSNIIRLNVTGEAGTTIDWNGNWTYKILNN